MRNSVCRILLSQNRHFNLQLYSSTIAKKPDTSQYLRIICKSCTEKAKSVGGLISGRGSRRELRMRCRGSYYLGREINF